MAAGGEDQLGCSVLPLDQPVAVHLNLDADPEPVAAAAPSTDTPKPSPGSVKYNAKVRRSSATSICGAISTDPDRMIMQEGGGREWFFC